MFSSTALRRMQHLGIAQYFFMVRFLWHHEKYSRLERSWKFEKSELRTANIPSCNRVPPQLPRRQQNGGTGGRAASPPSAAVCCSVFYLLDYCGNYSYGVFVSTLKNACTCPVGILFSICAVMSSYLHRRACPKFVYFPKCVEHCPPPPPPMTPIVRVSIFYPSHLLHPPSPASCS